MFTRQLIFLILLLSMIMACRKEEESIHYARFTQDALDWGFYNNGSYWVYKDSVSNKTDSLEIDTTYFGRKILYKGHDGHDPDFYYDYFHLYYKKNMFGIVEDYTQIDCNRNRGTLDRIMYDSLMLPVLFYNCINVLHKVDTFKYSGLVKEFIASYSEYTIGGKTFKDVTAVKITDIRNSRSGIYYFAKLVGMIKMRIEKDGKESTHELIDWKALKSP